LRNSISATFAARSLALGAALAVLVSCGGREDDGRAEREALVALVSPHRDVLARFDRWAHRVASAEAVWSNREALEETAFTPVRHAPGIVGAWIQRGAHPPLAFPHDAPIPEGEARRVTVPGLGEVEVTRATMVRRRETLSVLLVSAEREGLRTTAAIDLGPPAP
jgi:hypothetical protein